MNTVQGHTKASDRILGWLVIIGLYVLVVYSLIAFCDFIGFHIVEFVASRLHNDRFWAFWAVTLLLIPCFLVLAMAVTTTTAILMSVRKFVAGRKRCDHGIRKADENACDLCAAERALKEREWQQEVERRELKEKCLAESKALRTKEIARLSKAWLAQSDSYFSMSPREFEDAVARLFMELGYEVNQTPYSNDGGKDAIISKANKKFVVECKRYDRDALTGRRDLQILIAAKHDVGAEGAFFISTGRLARTAIKYATENQITVFDGDHLPILVNDAFGLRSTIPPAKVMCESCGEIVSFNIFGGQTAVKRCKNQHEVFCNIKLSDLSVATTLENPTCPNHRIPMRMVRARNGAFWECPSYPRCEVRIPIKPLMNLTNIPDEEVCSRTVATQEDAPEEQINCISLANSRKWNIWAPILIDSEEPNMHLAVPCGPTAPDREEYRERLYDYMRELILADPRSAEKTINDFCGALIGPNLAYDITHRDQMEFFLDEVDWARKNPPLKLPEGGELPTLLDMLQMIDMII